MTAAEFKGFKGIVEAADANDRIWWDGFYWINLTKRQAETVDIILRGKGCIDTVTDCRGRKAHRFPSGLTLAYAKD